MASTTATRCPTCRCSIHTPARTWEVKCVQCGLMKYPLAVEDPEPYTCRLCLSVPPEKRAARSEAAKRGQATRRDASVASLDGEEGPKIPEEGHDGH